MQFRMIFLTQLLNLKIVYCLLLRLTLFTQKHSPVLGRDGLSASGAGKCLGPPRAKVPPGFECGFVQDSRLSKVLPKRWAGFHVSERVWDVNDVVLSRFPQCCVVRESVLS